MGTHKCSPDWKTEELFSRHHKSNISSSVSQEPLGLVEEASRKVLFFLKSTWKSKLALYPRLNSKELIFSTLFFISSLHLPQIYFSALTMTLPQIKLEFQPEHVQYTTFALYCGLLVGAVFWGFGADVFGFVSNSIGWRRPGLCAFILSDP